MFPLPRRVPSQQPAELALVALLPIFCKEVLQPSARPQPQPPPIGQSLRAPQLALARQSASAQRPLLPALAAQAL